VDSWAKYNPNWYTTSINIKTDEQLEELLMWIDSNIPGHRKHTIWRFRGDNIFEIRFRHERDYEWFVLRWG